MQKSLQLQREHESQQHGCAVIRHQHNYEGLDAIHRKMDCFLTFGEKSPACASCARVMLDDPKTKKSDSHLDGAALHFSTCHV